MTNRSVILLLSVVLLASALTAGCTSNVLSPSPSASATNQYNSTKGYLIKYPSNWGKPEEQQNGTLAVFFPTNNKTENLNVQVANLSASETLTNVTTDIISTAKSYTDFKQIEATNATLAGNPGYKIVYVATINGYQLKILQRWTVKDGKAYIITYKAAPTNFDTYLSAAQQMIDSFQIK